MFGEDDELAQPSVGIRRQYLVVKDVAQLGPLRSVHI